jgi:hypothetical protein
LISGIPADTLKLSSEYIAYNLASRYNILTNPILIPYNVMPSNVQSWYPNIAILDDLLYHPIFIPYNVLPWKLHAPGLPFLKKFCLLMFIAILHDPFCLQK